MWAMGNARLLARRFREAFGLGVALICIGWVLLHLVGFFFYGYILVGETNLLVLSVEAGMVLFGLICFLITQVEDRRSSRQ